MASTPDLPVARVRNHLGVRWPSFIDRAIFLGRARALAWLTDAAKRGDATGVLETVRWAFVADPE
jgi:hypothetical protein